MIEKRKKILFIVEAMGGGVFTYIVDLANELVNTHDMYVAYATRRQTPSNFQSYFDERIHLIEVKNFVRTISLTKDFKAFFEIKKIAKNVQPEIMHLHSSKAGVLGRWAINGHKVPLFYTPHGFSFLMANYGLAKRSIYKAIETISSKRYCRIISCSEGEYHESLKLTKNASYVNNGINITDLQGIIDSIRKSNTHQFTVFTLGRICYQKNPVLFNDIALKMPEVRFIWIGGGELQEKLTAPNIEVTGWVDRKKALGISLGGDVFMLTSLWEGLPISLLEAMYMKKVCVVSDVIGNHDVISNQKNGFICKTADEFVIAINQCRNQKVKKLVENAYSDVLSTYNTKIMADNYVRIYEGLK